MNQRFGNQREFREAYENGMGALMQFQCPRCGGSAFGSSGRYPNTTRTCHGSTCGFTWGTRHDHLYFSLRTKV